MKLDRCFRYMAILSLVLFATLSLHGWVSSAKLSAIYGLPQEELVARLGEHTVLFSSISRISDGSQHGGIFKRLSGAMPAGELSVSKGADCTAAIHPTFGKCKILLIPDAEDAPPILLEDSRSVAVSPGVYRLYYIGSAFWGTVDLVLS